MTTLRRAIVLFLAALTLAACASGPTNTASSSTTSVSTSTSSSTTTTEQPYEAVTSQGEYYGVYTPNGGPKAAKSYLYWKRSGPTATGTLKVGNVSALRRMGLATTTYAVKLTFAGKSLTMTISGHGVSQVTHGTLNLTGVLIMFPAGGGHSALSVQFQRVTPPKGS